MTGDAKALLLAAVGVLTVAGTALALAERSDKAAKAQALAQSNEAQTLDDAADVFTPAQEAELTRKLLALKREVGPQLVVTTITTLDGQNIQRLTDKWANDRRIGDATKGEGVVILVAPDDKQVRIAYTNNLRGQLSDAFCAKVIKDAMIPQFRNGAILEGVNAGVDSLYAELRRVKAIAVTPSAAPTTRQATGGSPRPAPAAAAP